MKFLTSLSALFAAAVSTATVTAQSATDCDLLGYVNSVEHIPQPWEDFTRVYANGAVRLSLLDTIEPAVGAVFLMVQSPPKDPTFGIPSCKIIGSSPDSGFSDIEWDALVADYDPEVGLQFEVPISLFDPASGTSEPDTLAFSVNQATGDIGTTYGSTSN